MSSSAAVPIALPPAAAHELPKAAVAMPRCTNDRNTPGHLRMLWPASRELPLVVGLPADATSVLRVECDCGLGACAFHGVVRSIRTAVLDEPRDNQTSPLHGVLVLLETSSASACSRLELARPASAEVVSAIGQGALPEASAIFVSVPRGSSLPFVVGDPICGSVRRFGLGYDEGADAMISRPGGELLIAYAHSMPYPADLLPGWRFEMGASTARSLRDEDYWFIEHKTLLKHAGVTVPIANGGHVELHAPEGVYDVIASSYTTEGPLPPWMAWLSRRGYGFSIVLQRHEVLPPLAQDQICAGDRSSVTAVLDGYPKDPENPRDGSVTIAELGRVTPMLHGEFGDMAAGAGYWGSTDLDGDGMEDRIVEYDGVDFWSRLFFVRRGDCFSFAGLIEGYQVQMVPMPGGVRNARVLTYPNGPASRIESYRWTGRRFQRR